MALILETGEGLANADSLVSLAEVRVFASSRGKSVTSVDADLETQVRVAHDYLLANEARLMGCRRTNGQALSFPRNGLVLFGFEVTEGVIPTGVKNAICQLVLEGLEADLLPTQDGRVIKSETLGPIKTDYESTGVATANPSMPRVDAFLGQLLLTTGLRSERV